MKNFVHARVIVEHSKLHFESHGHSLQFGHTYQ